MTRLNFERLLPPPRRVPPGLQLYALFGDSTGRVGWFVLALSSLFCWPFLLRTEIAPFFLRGPVGTTSGQVTSVTETGSSENDETILAVAYSFRVGDDQPHSGRSYVTGSAATVGDRVTVEYAEGAPQVSRIQGMRSAPFGKVVLSVLIFPAVGVLLVWVSLSAGLKQLRLLRGGRVGEARLKNKADTRKTHGDDDEPVYRYDYEFVAEDGRRHEFQYETHRTGPLETETSRALLYLPERPATRLWVDDLPQSIEADGEGNVFLASPSAAVRSLFLPGLVLLGNGAYAVLRWVR